MIRVMYLGIDGPGGFMERTFDDECVPKVLVSGALRITQPANIEIPPMGTTTDGKEDKDIVKTPEYVLAIFQGEYVMERSE